MNCKREEMEETINQDLENKKVKIQDKMNPLIMKMKKISLKN